MSPSSLCLLVLYHSLYGFRERLSHFSGRVSSEDEKRVCSCKARLKREHIYILLSHEGVSKVSERAREQSK